MNWWIVGLVLLACAGGGLFLAFRSPTFVAGLAAIAASAAWKAIIPGMLKGISRSPEGVLKDKQTVREGGTPHVKMPGPKPRKHKPTGKVTVKVNK